MVTGVLHKQVWSHIDGVLFDLDGVITPSAELHQRAWLLALRTFSATEGDYLSFIDGRPRLDGVRTFLESRNLHLPDGAEGDEPSINTVHGIAALKQQSFLQILDQEPFAPYSGSIALLDALEQRGEHLELRRQHREYLRHARRQEAYERLDGRLGDSVTLSYRVIGSIV